MAKKLIFFLIFYTSFFLAQKIKIVDAETSNAIPNVRILSENNVYYTNDDGFILLPENSKNVEVSAYGYETIKEQEIKSILKLKPLYKNIDEIKIVVVDIKKIFSDVLKNYEKRYYNQPSLYNIIYQQKNKSNNEINFLFIFNGKLWTSSNTYSFKEGNNKKFDDFIQMKIDTVRYYKSKNLVNELEFGALDKSKDFIGDVFLNYQLSTFVRLYKMRGSKYSGHLLNDDNNEQTISYKISLPESIEISGTFLYNKVDKVISHLEVNYDQTKIKAYEKKTENGESYQYKLGNGSIIYDFYKKNNQYIPSAVFTEGSGFTSILNDKIFENSFERKIIFQKFSETETTELPNKIDLTKKIWENIPISEQKDNSILLSEDEQKFIDEKIYEK